MNEAAVLAILKKRVAALGSTQASVAAALAISPAYLCDVMQGRRGLSDKVLKKLGIERVVTYRKARK